MDACWMCDGGRLRIFVGPAGKVQLEHLEPACAGFVASKLIADEYLADVRRANAAPPKGRNNSGEGA